MMNNKNPQRAGRICVAVGVLMVTTPFLINDWLHVPDFIRGLFMGIGITFEIAGLIHLNRAKKTNAACNGN
jgi:hypothetical protein